MNYYFDEEVGKNVENYNSLAIAIVSQAIRDVEAGMKLKKRLRGRKPISNKEITIQSNKEDAISFFKSHWFKELCEIDGDTVLKKAISNIYKYGSAMFPQDDWDRITRGETPCKRRNYG